MHIQRGEFNKGLNQTFAPLNSFSPQNTAGAKLRLILICCGQLGFVRNRHTSLYFSFVHWIKVGQLSAVNETELHIL